ncbi:MAG: 2-oxoglutarate and iron-dependent oxygenase domain-containing protein [Pseudomonadota bacterium]
MTTYAAVPELSLAAFTDGSDVDRAAFQAGLMEGLTYFGFVILKDHPVSTELLARAYKASAAFFALPEDEKLAYMVGTDGQRGYTPFGREHAKDARAPDLKEFWHVGREFPPDDDLADIYPPNVWPDRPAGFREAFLALYAALEEAGLLMLDALAPSLEVAPAYFRDMAGAGNSILRLLHYPPVPDGADPASVRAAAHEDINLITILVAANGAGLQLLDRNGEWLPVETDPDNLIVDAGDMLARITNDRIPATTHRVVNPVGPNVSRYSMPFFMHPRPDAVLSCIESCRDPEFEGGAKYPDTTAMDFLRERLAAIGLGG